MRLDVEGNIVERWFFIAGISFCDAVEQNHTIIIPQELSSGKMFVFIDELAYTKELALRGTQIKISINKIVNFTVKNGVGIFVFMFSASIFDEFVGLEDVITNLLAPFSSFAGAELIDAFDMLFLFHLKELAAENFHSFFFVLELRAFVLNGDDGIGRKVGDADSGIGRIDTLSAVSAGMIDVNAEILVVNFNSIIIFKNRKNFNERERCLAEIISVER